MNMKHLALILLALTSGAEASEFTVRTAQKPAYMCEVDKKPVGCAYLLALYQKIRDEVRKTDKGI